MLRYYYLNLNFRKNYLEVRIFFEEMNIDTTEQKPAYEAGDILGMRAKNEIQNIDSLKFYFSTRRSAQQSSQLMFFSADIGGTAGLFLGASLLTVLEMGEFLFLSVMSILSHLSGAGKMKKKHEATLNESRSYNDKNGIYGSIFSTPASGRSIMTVHKINVQKQI